MKCHNLKLLNLTELYVEDLQDYSNFKTKHKFDANSSYLKMYLPNKITNKQLNIISYCIGDKRLLYFKIPIEI